MNSILCRLLGHRRSVSNAYRTPRGWLSRCKRCGTKLARVAPSDWRDLSEIGNARLLTRVDPRDAAIDEHCADSVARFVLTRMPP